SQQCYDNLRAGEDLGELDHPAQILLAETASMEGLQLSPHCCDNLRAVLGTPSLENLGEDAMAELPVERGERCICGDGHLAPRGLDHLPEVADERRDLAFIDKRRWR